MRPASWSPLRGLEPTPAEARRWLSDELHRSDYSNPWLDSALRWIGDQLAKLLDGVNELANSGFSFVVTLLVALVTIAILAWVLPKVRRESTVARKDGGVLVDPTITSSTYRKLAAQAFADGRYDDAVLDGFRAIAKDTSDRMLLDDAPGRTAHEISLGLAQPFPQLAERLAHCANLFDAVRYGHRRATADQAGQVLRLDAELATTRPMLLSSPIQNASV